MRTFTLMLVGMLGASTPLAAQSATFYALGTLPITRLLQSPAADSALTRARRLAILRDTSRLRFLVLMDSSHRRLCPMPVVIPDTARLAPMPSALSGLRPTPMPTASASCHNPLFRP